MFLSRKYSITINNDSSREKQDTPPEISEAIKNHIDENIPYFSKILGSHIKNHSNLTSQDMFLLREAYDKSHASKNFEIELYWKRAAYAWTLIAALITLFGLLINTYISKIDTSSPVIIGIFAVAIIGVFITIICHLIIQSGEHWKKNWEMHTVLLEPLFSGSLYSTHVTGNVNRLSIAKLNGFLYLLILGCWLLMIEFILAVKFGGTLKTFLWAVFIFSILVLSYTFFISKVTSSNNDTISVVVTGYKINTSANTKELSKNKKTRYIFIMRQLLKFTAIIFILFFTFLYLVLDYDVNEIKSLFNI